MPNTLFAVAAPAVPLTYLRDIRTISSPGEYKKNAPKSFLEALEEIRGLKIPYSLWPNGAGIVCKGARLHLRAQLCMYSIAYPGSVLSAGACVGGETLVHGSVLGSAETNGCITIEKGAVIKGDCRVYGNVVLKKQATVKDCAEINAKSQITVISGVIKDYAKLTDFVSGGKSAPRPYSIDGAHGVFEIGGSTWVSSGEALQAHMDAQATTRASLV